jgi:enoyl-CoA hydratase/carnithine racemase
MSTQFRTQVPTEPAVVLLEKMPGNVAVVTLNRPEVHNSINRAISRQMLSVVYQVESDPEIRAVVLTGAGPSFCAGADLKEVNGSVWNIADGPAGFAGFVYAERSKPWIAAVRGAALGGGTEIALSCEMVVAGKGARFGLPEVRRSLIPGAGGAFRLPRAVPRSIANEMILTGLPIDAERAFVIGLVNQVVDDEQVVPAALEMARTIAGNAPQAVRESMRLLGLVDELSDEELARHTVRAIGRLMHTQDFREGPRAFFEKRPPNWLGR